MRGSDFGNILMVCLIGGLLDYKPLRTTTLLKPALLVLAIGAFTYLGWAIRGINDGWRPVTDPMGPAPSTVNSTMHRKGYWYSWYENDKGELLFKRGGPSGIRVQVRYTDGTTETL